MRPVFDTRPARETRDDAAPIHYQQDAAGPLQKGPCCLPGMSVEFDVIRAFESEQEAQDYAAENGIDDVRLA